MNTVADGLVLAIRSLPKDDKARVLKSLLEDGDVRRAIAELLVKELVSPIMSHNGGKHRPISGELLGTSDTSKERGRRIRESYILELARSGLKINQVDNVWAKTPSGLWVAIPFATERRSGRWFLGLPENEVIKRIQNGGVVVVLLCQSVSGPVLDFVLPSSKFSEIVNLLSKSKGQLKFNLKRVGNRYYLVLPSHGSLDVSEYKGNLSVLKR